MTLIPHFVQNELDTSDTDLDERLSMFNFCNSFDDVLPFADGTIGETDRAHLWGMFSGIAIGARHYAGFTRNLGQLLTRR